MPDGYMSPLLDAAGPEEDALPIGLGLDDGLGPLKHGSSLFCHVCGSVYVAVHFHDFYILVNGIAGSLLDGVVV